MTALNNGRGPIEHALVRVLLALDAIRDLLGGPDADLEIEPCDQPTIGDFRIHLGPNMPAERQAAKAFGHKVATILAAHPDLERVVSIPPCVVVRPTLEFMLRCVNDAIKQAPDAYGTTNTGGGRRVVVSFSSPNANKPLHLGHMRNNFLGMALANLLQATGHAVVRTAVMSDWGVHICQAALAYQHWGEGRTPEAARRKSDAFVGDHYVRFHTERTAASRSDAPASTTDGGDDTETTQLDRAALELLAAVERADGAAFDAQQRMVDWASHGIATTYRRLGSRFDAIFRERDMLASARAMLHAGVARGVAAMRSDGSVYVDLGDGIGPITFLRADGTAVAYTQLVGVYLYRVDTMRPDAILVVLGHEWELGFKIIRETMRRFGCVRADVHEPLYYGMVTLASGKMKSREGTVVEVDDLLDRVRDRIVAQWGAQWGNGGSDEERARAAETLGLGLVNNHFLRSRRAQPVAYDENLIWTRAQERFALLVRAACPDAGEGAHAEVSAAKAIAEARRRLLLAMNDLPRCIGRAVVMRDPAVVLRLLDEVAEQAQRALPWRTDDDARELSRSVATCIHRGLALLNIELPHGPLTVGSLTTR